MSHHKKVMANPSLGVSKPGAGASEVPSIIDEEEDDKSDDSSFTGSSGSGQEGDGDS